MSAISAAELKLGNLGQKESPEAADQVIGQSLSPGSRVPVGQVIDIVTAQQETTTVPNLVGDSEDEASSIISDARLKLGSVRQEESEKPVDQVIRQSLRPGSRVPVGQVIEIVTARSETTIVPDVSGLQLDEGFRKLASARLQLGNVSREPRPQSHEGVLRQTPAAGSRVAVNSMVDLVVATSAGMVKVPNLPGKSKEAATPPLTSARVRVPDVIGETRDEASTALSQAGFKMGAVREQFSLFHTAGKVYSQEPAAGTLLAAPESVDLIVSTRIPTWAVASFLVLAGTAVGFLIRGRTQALWHKPPPTEQINWSTRVHKDIGSQQVEHGAIPVGPDIRVRPIIDRGTQSIRETPAVRSDRAA
jgi:beta-lactam-binding protein with PASTA domain